MEQNYNDSNNINKENINNGNSKDENKKETKQFIEIEEKEISQLIYKIFSNTRRHLIKLYSFKSGLSTADFQFMKSEINKLFHNQFIFIFKKFKDLGYLERCTCNGMLKDFPSGCLKCKGTGYINSQKIIK